ncbi:MAG TPA: hypothetical protein DCW35_09545 [Polynucleobacter sp.]|nr:hypothetical protein [Polynucleobacter sp.]
MVRANDKKLAHLNLIKDVAL